MEEFGQKMERLQGRNVHFQRASQHTWGRFQFRGCDYYQRATEVAVSVTPPAPPAPPAPPSVQ